MVIDFEAFKDTSVYERYMLNSYQFSAAKSAAEAQQMQEQVFGKDGVIKSYSQFQKDANAIATTSQESWLRVERDMCIRQAVQAQSFRAMQADADLYPYWIYTGVMDAVERAEHVELEGKIFKIGDANSDACFPPNDWNCRCSGEQTDNEADKKVTTNTESKELLDTDVDIQFRYNPANEGMMPKVGGYFKIMPSANKVDSEVLSMPKIAEKPKKIIKQPIEIVKPIEKPTKAPKPKVLPKQTEKQRIEQIKEDLDKIKKMIISTSEKESVSMYTGSDYRKINNFYRNGVEMEKKFKTNCGVLDKFLERAPKVKMETYRGISLPNTEAKEFAKNLKIGNIYTDKGYMSTSFDREKIFGSSSKERTSIVFEIYGKNGVAIQNLSDVQPEEEVLFGRNSKFYINDFKVENNKEDGKIKQILVTLIEK